MTLYLDEDEFFSMNAYVQSIGDQTIALSGYLVEHRSDGTYIAPLIPDLFYGASGSQLQHSWRQNFTVTGDQTILSRSGGQPSVPRNELYWRKISDRQEPKEQVKATETRLAEAPPIWIIPVSIVGAIVATYVVYKILK